jgi:hypothetical protein
LPDYIKDIDFEGLGIDTKEIEDDIEGGYESVKRWFNEKTFERPVQKSDLSEYEQKW